MRTEFAGSRATERLSNRVPRHPALHELNKECVNSRDRSTAWFPGSSYPASHWPFLQFLRMPPKGENRPNDTILAEFLWFPLGQLIALQSSRRIAKRGQGCIRHVSSTEN